MLDLDKAYVSPIDKFLFAFDRKHEKTRSQLKEIKKHARIFRLRDAVKAHLDRHRKDEK